jgi:hypothetical protein
MNSSLLYGFVEVCSLALLKFSAADVRGVLNRGRIFITKILQTDHSETSRRVAKTTFETRGLGSKDHQQVDTVVGYRMR